MIHFGRLIWKNSTYGVQVRPPRVHLSIDRYSWGSQWGPLLMDATAQSSKKRLFGLIPYLGAPVELQSWRGRRLWWGKFHELRIQGGGMEVSISLDTLTNRTQAVFTFTGGGQSGQNTSGKTAWADDLDSQALYGIKELMLTATDKTQAEAEAYRDRILSEMLKPQAFERHNGSGQTPLRAQLLFRGYGDTLDWQYYASGAGIVSSTSATKQQKMGQTLAAEKLAQSFQTSSAVTARLLIWRWHMSRVGSVGDNSLTDIYANVAGAPGGASLGQVAVAGIGMKTQNEWVDFDFTSAALDLSPSTTYWSVLSRSGGVPPVAPDQYYKISVDENLGYAGGSFLVYESGAWAVRSPDADACFQLVEGWDPVNQLADVVDECGQFFAGTDLILTSSGLQTNPYQNADKTGLQVARSILENGATSGGKRILAHVTPERILRVEAEPDPPATSLTAPLRITADGRIRTRFGQWVREPMDAVRLWARSAAADDIEQYSRYVKSPGMEFVDEAEKDCRTGQVRIVRAKNQNELAGLNGPLEG